MIQSTNDASVRAEVTRLSSRVAGEVLTVAANDFQRVKAGHLLVQIDPADYQAQVARAWPRVREQIHSNFTGQHLDSGSAGVARILKQLSDHFAGHGAATAPARAVGSLSALVARESNVLAYIDGFWLTFWIAILALGVVAFITRAPPGPLTPAPFGVVEALMRRLGWTRT